MLKSVIWCCEWERRNRNECNRWWWRRRKNVLRFVICWLMETVKLKCFACLVFTPSAGAARLFMGSALAISWTGFVIWMHPHFAYNNTFERVASLPISSNYRKHDNVLCCAMLRWNFDEGIELLRELHNAITFLFSDVYKTEREFAYRVFSVNLIDIQSVQLNIACTVK